MYLVLAIFVVLTTFTRGVYFAFLLLNLLAPAILLFHKKLKLNKMLITFFICTFSLILIIPTGKLDSFFDRAMTGLELVSNEKLELKLKKEDTFHGRLAVLKERMQMVANKNIVLGYGFIYEEIAMRTLKYKTGTPHTITQQLAFFSADIAWANMFSYTGYVGVTIFVILILSVIANYFHNKPKKLTKFFLLRLSFFLQFIYLVIVMLNGATFTLDVEIPCLILAGYTYSSSKMAI